MVTFGDAIRGVGGDIADYLRQREDMKVNQQQMNAEQEQQRIKESVAQRERDRQYRLQLDKFNWEKETYRPPQNKIQTPHHYGNIESVVADLLANGVSPNDPRILALLKVNQGLYREPTEPKPTPQQIRFGQWANPLLPPTAGTQAGSFGALISNLYRPPQPIARHGGYGPDGSFPTQEEYEDYLTLTGQR
jgi:hypothetical protein